MGCMKHSRITRHERGSTRITNHCERKDKKREEMVNSAYSLVDNQLINYLNMIGSHKRQTSKG